MFNKKPSDYLQRTWAAIGVGVVSIGVGAAQKIKADKAAKAAQGKIQPYKTPKEVFDVLNATQANAQSGFDQSTLGYLTGQTDQAFAGSIGSAQRLGADPNVLSSIFSQKVDSIKGIAAQDAQLQMQNFSAYLNALNATGASSAAEQKSQQDLLKDQLQKIAMDKQIASQQISQGINAGISGIANYSLGQLLNPNDPRATVPRTTNSTGYTPPPVVSQSEQYRKKGLGIG